MDDTSFNVWRSGLETDEWLAERFARGQAWIDLIGLAHQEDGVMFVRKQKVEVKRGQVSWSQLALSRRWKWHRNSVSNFLDSLESRGKVVQRNNHLTSLITIVDYEDRRPPCATESAPKKQPKSSKPKAEFSEDVETMFAFFCKELEVAPKNETSGIDWRHAIRLTIGCDKRDKGEMCRVIRWVSQAIEEPKAGSTWRGWRAVIKSPIKFRSHYETLLERSKAPAKGQPPPRAATLTPDMLKDML